MIEKKKLDSRREQKNYLNTVDKCSSGAMTNWGACSYFDREREKYFGRDRLSGNEWGFELKKCVS